MNINDLKVGLLNSVTFLATIAHIDQALKIILVLMSIVYTAIRIHKSLNEKKDKDDKKL
jgi:hypothetical protein